MQRINIEEEKEQQEQERAKKERLEFLQRNNAEYIEKYRIRKGEESLKPLRISLARIEHNTRFDDTLAVPPKMLRNTSASRRGENR